MVFLPSIFLFYVFSLTEANFHSPRMVFTHDESAVASFTLPERSAPVQVLLTQPDVVTCVGERHVNYYNFKTPQKDPVEKTVVLKDCTDHDCDYNIIMVHQREVDRPAFVCGTTGKSTRCCDMNLSEQSHECVPSERLKKIQNTIRQFDIKRGEHSLLTESGQSEDLYVTYSGAQENVGLHKFGSGRVGPKNHNEEQYYVGLVLSKRNQSSQNKIYAFYKQKNKEAEMDGDMWLPYVSQVCMSDIGGPKNNLQFSWTSQMNTRLYCGNPNTKQDFSELVDVATVYSDHWEETKVYALFRNEWGISAVCVYTIGDINNIFTTSRFKDSETYNDQDQRRKECVPDSTTIPTEILMRIKKTSEVEQRVLPVNKSGPILFTHRNYTRIHVSDSQQMVKGHHVMFLTLNDGRIHKAVQNGSHSFIIAEYQPFNYSAHMLSVILHHLPEKLYVSSRSELVQLDVANCARYGNTCAECVLSGDPYCQWTGKECTAGTRGLPDMNRRHQDVCSNEILKQKLISNGNRKENDEMVSPQSKYFLSCAVSSHHAQYTWHHPGGPTSCDPKDGKCVLLIDSMGPDQEGMYECKSEEMGYSRALEKHHLQLRSAAVGWTVEPALWVCLVAVLFQNF